MQPVFLLYNNYMHDPQEEDDIIYTRISALMVVLLKLQLIRYPEHELSWADKVEFIYAMLSARDN